MITDVQKILLDMLDELIRICEDNNLTVYPYRETALAAYRNQGFETGTQVIELLMPVADLISFKKIVGSSGIPGRTIEDHFGNMKIKDAKVNYVNTETTYFDFVMDKNRKEAGLHITIYPLFYVTDTPEYRKYEAMWTDWLKHFKILPRKNDIFSRIKFRNIRKNPEHYAEMLLEQMVKSQNSVDSASETYVLAGFKDRKEIPAEIFKEPVTVEFENRQMKFPSDAVAFFTPQFGTNWEQVELKFTDFDVDRLVDINLPYRFFVEACREDDVNMELGKSFKECKEARVRAEEIEAPLRQAWDVITRVGESYLD